MLRNYVILAWRNMLRNKIRSVIHLLGLAIGIATCFIIFNFYAFEYSFDNFHPDKDKIFRVNTITKYKGETWPNSGVPYPLGEVIDTEIASITNKVQLNTPGGVMVRTQEPAKNFGRQSNVVYASNSVFEVFPRNWLAGNNTSVLEAPNEVVLTENAVDRYFGSITPSEAIGKEIIYHDTLVTTVVGVVEDFKENSDIVFTDFISLVSLTNSKGSYMENLTNWGNVNSSSQLFIKLSSLDQKQEVLSGLETILDKYTEKDEDGGRTFHLEPLSELHFSDNYSNYTGSKEILKGLFFIGLFILLIACFNFINLETAQAINRSKEIGIRKTLGSSRSQLILQFLTETYIIVMIAVMLSFLITELSLRYFQDFLPSALVIDYLSGQNIAFLLLFGLSVTMLSGVYPAYILGSYQPQKVIREKSSVQRSTFGYFLRKNLTVLQFTLSISFIIIILVVSAQINYISNKDLGFDNEEIMVSITPFADPLKRNETLKSQIEKLSFVKSVSLSNDALASGNLSTTTFEYEMEGEKQEFDTQTKEIDSSFVNVYGIPLLAGRNIRNVSDEVLINEKLAKNLGFASVNEAIGQQISYYLGEMQIVGVVGDLHSRSLREEIRPLMMYYQPTYFYVISAKLEKNTNIAEAKMMLDQLHKETYPNESQEFKFFDESIQNLYNSEKRLSSVLSFTTILAILISCLGLFGLSSFTIAQRTKEISIRKVLGASIENILYLISKEYIVLVIVSFVLSIFPAWYFLDDWLKDYAYRIDMPIFLFPLAGGFVLLLALLIVGIHSIRSATRNPAEVLKDE
ncbi:ABC transporter permease [Fulvivirgaceae bacterium LMO-SS25]